LGSRTEKDQDAERTSFCGGGRSREKLARFLREVKVDNEGPGRRVFRRDMTMRARHLHYGFEYILSFRKIDLERPFIGFTPERPYTGIHDMGL
jgi:hypothetical protein